MKRVLLLMGILLAATTALAIGAAIASAMAVRRVLPAERRAKIRERVFRAPRAMMGWMMERMPGDAPPKVVMSGMQEQNEQLLALLREQNDLLRERLPLQESSSPSSSPKRQRD